MFISTIQFDIIYNAHIQVSASNGLGIKTVAVITKMDHPIGYGIGNALEVAESILCLQGNGPKSLNELVCTLGETCSYSNCKKLIRASCIEESKVRSV